MRTISSRRNPIVKLFQDAVRRRAPSDAIVLEGARLLADASAAGVDITHVVFSAERVSRETRALIDRLDRHGVTTTAATAAVLSAASPARSPSGVVSLARRPASDLGSLLRRAPHLVLLAIGVQDPGNVGALIRSAEAAHASGVIVSGGSADPFGWKAIRGSMGSVFRLPAVVADSPEEVIRAARTHQLRIFAAAPHHGLSLFDVSFLNPSLIVLGAEGPGLPPEMVELADETITIPMSGEVESLNVGVAGAILLYEAFRQRRAATLGVRVDRIGGM